MDNAISVEAHQRNGRQDMRALAKRPMTADEFLYRFDGAEGRWELVDGEPRMMAGASLHHNRISANILAVLKAKLRGSGCQPFGSDMGVRIDLRQIRYPDAVVLCDPRDLEVDELQTAHFPAILFEVFSPSTADADQGVKLLEYRRLPSVRAVVHVDPATETVLVYERIGEREWRETIVARGEVLQLLAVDCSLTTHDIFRRD